MKTFIIIMSIILYLLIGIIIWYIFAVKIKYNSESIHIFMFLLFWPIILLVTLYKYIRFNIELYKLLEKVYNYEYDSKNR